MSSFPGRLRAALENGGLLVLLAILRRIPRAHALRLAGALGRLWVQLGLPRTSTALLNLRIAFPDWPESRRRRLLERAFANLGRGVVEMASLESMPGEELERLVRVEGIEHLEAARRASPHGGVIAVTAHLGNWELLAVAMGWYGVPVSIVHRERANPTVERVMRAWRERFDGRALPRGSAARPVLRALREGRVVAMPLDQDTPRQEGIFVPFFSRLACTRDAPVRIAMRTGAPVVPVFIFRLGESDRHAVRFYPALPMESGDGPRDKAIRENVLRITRAIEAAIRAAPDQWTWNHRRWKTQPPGEPRPYPSRRRRSFRLPG
jgi:KDO2-lipid IV(A) lauroyltransferase